MSCLHSEHDLCLHAHGELSGLRRWRMESRLRACASCRTELARWTVEKDALQRGLGAAHRGRASDRVLDTVSALIRLETRRDAGRRHLSQGRLMMLPVGAMLIALFGGTAAALTPGRWISAGQSAPSQMAARPQASAAATDGCGRCHTALPADCSGAESLAPMVRASR